MDMEKKQGRAYWARAIGRGTEEAERMNALVYGDIKERQCGLVCNLSDSFDTAVLTNTGRNCKGAAPPEEVGLRRAPPYRAR